MKGKLTSKEEEKCREAYESYRKQKLGLKNFAEYTGWREAWIYRNQLRKAELDNLVDELYNDIEQEKFMKEKGALK